MPAPDSPRSSPPTLVDLNRLWVDSRVRAYAQRRLEAPALVRMGGPLGGGTAVELGTGRRGTGLRIALEQLGADHVVGLDLHPDSVVASGRAVADLTGRVTLRQADVSRRIPLDDGAADAVLAFHVLHHAEDWRAVVREGARVLRPGGRWYGVEMTRRFVDSRLLRLVSKHPDGDRPSTEDVLAAMADAGLEVADRVLERVGGAWLRYVAVKPSR